MLKALTTAAVAIVIAASVNAEPLTIGTGKEGGGYDRRAREIAERLTQRGIETTVVNMNGSEEISLAVCAGRADLGLMQIDAIYSRALEGCDLKPVASHGTEYAFLLFPPKSRHSELSDLTEQDAILADTIGSGSDLWLRTAIKIETGDDGDKDAWSKLRIVNDPIDLAHASAELGDISGVLLVRKPDSADISRLFDLGWTLGYLWDRDLDGLKFKEKPLYEGEKVTLRYQGKTFKNWAYQVRSFVVANPKIAAGDRKVFGAITAAAGN